ncbi:MAG: hypothetical protein Q9200_004791 [Gallowayella weberi]
MVRYARANRKIIGAYHLKLGSLSKETFPTTNNDSQSTPGKYTAETYTRRADHTPQPAQRENKTYILTLKTDIAHQETLTSLRNKYFPTNINKLFAHVTLFRALPGSKLPAIQVAIKRLVRQTSTFPISTGEPFLMSYGVGLDANVEPAKEIFETLRKQWSGFLSIQDRSFKPHYTIQNYVDQSVAEETLAEVRNSFGGSAGTVQGLLLWEIPREGSPDEHRYETVGAENLDTKSEKTVCSGERQNLSTKSEKTVYSGERQNLGTKSKKTVC